VEERKKMPIQGKKKGYRMNEDMKLIRKTIIRMLRTEINATSFSGFSWDEIGINGKVHERNGPKHKEIVEMHIHLFCNRQITEKCN
jgi:hypothetical protein